MINLKRGIPKATALAAFIFLFFLSFASAEIVSTEPNPIYNIGDNFNLTVTIISSKDATSFFSTVLACEKNRLEIFKLPLSLKLGERREILIEGKFDSFLLGSNQRTKCYFDFSYGSDTLRTVEFSVVNDLKVELNIEGIMFEPGSPIRVSGTAKKATGTPVSGFIEVAIPSLNISSTNTVSDGSFDFSFVTPINSPATTYQVKFTVYEKNSLGEILNEGIFFDQIKIKQVMRELEISLVSNQTIVPGSEVLYTVLLKDQAGQMIYEDVAITISKPDGSSAEKRVVRSGIQNSFRTDYKSPPGDWKIESSVSSLKALKEFYVEEFMNATFSVINGTLIIKNTGNVPYTRPVEINVGGTVEVKEITVDVDGTKEIKLTPEKSGDYPVSISDGINNAELGVFSLTGKAISTEETQRDSPNKSNWHIWLWIFIILILTGVAIYFFRKLRKEKYFGKINPIHLSSGIGKVKTASSHQTANSRNKSSEIIEGKKEETAIISLNLRNFPEIKTKNSAGVETIQKIISKSKDSKAKVYADGDYRLIMISPSIYKTQEIIIPAIKLALEIEKMLLDHNKKFSEKIDFGLGLHFGEMIVQVEEGKFKFAPIGNTINTAKRIAHYSRSELLISEAVHRKTIGKVKSEKLENINLWRVKKVNDRSEHEDFISKFMQRQSKSSQHEINSKREIERANFQKRLSGIVPERRNISNEDNSSQEKNQKIDES